MFDPVPVESLIFNHLSRTTLIVYLLAECVVYRLYQKDVASTWRLLAAVLCMNLASILLGGLTLAVLPDDFDINSLLPPSLRDSIGVLLHLIFALIPFFLSWLVKYQTGRALCRWVPMTNLGWCVLLANGVGLFAIAVQFLWRYA